MVKMIKNIIRMVEEELERANQLHRNTFASPHEGWAILKEEVDELFEEVREKNPDGDRLLEEAIQVGAMAMKFCMSLVEWPWIALNISEKDYKCLTCRFRPKSIDELFAGYSGGGKYRHPCLSCRSTEQWEPELEQKWDACDDCGAVIALQHGQDFFIERGTHGVGLDEKSKMVCKDCHELKYKKWEDLGL
jgi:NTP pyrophosphatase (non-canonical NTP hydrolase)